MKKKKKPIYFEEKFILSIYKANVDFIFGDFKKYQATLKRRYDYEKKNEPLGNTVKVELENGEIIYILWLGKLDYGALAHEAVHVANYIFADRRIYIGGFKEDEPFTYLVEWIVNEYIDFVKRKRKK